MTQTTAQRWEDGQERAYHVHAWEPFLQEAETPFSWGGRGNSFIVADYYILAPHSCTALRAFHALLHLSLGH